MADFEVRRDNLRTTRVTEGEPAAERVDDGAVQLRVERFGLSANNVTYGAFGDAMDYWRFFPSGEDGWGIVPVWGFGTVLQSQHPGVAVGERLYGYWPMANAVVLQPDRLTATGFVDAAAHREGLHAVYNQYHRTGADPFYSAETESVQSLLRPLFVTSWLIDDFMADNQFYGADVLLLSS